MASQQIQATQPEDQNPNPNSPPYLLPAPAPAPAEPEKKRHSVQRGYEPGIRFMPSDECLVKDYLVKKIEGRLRRLEDIQEVELYKFNPDQLAEKYPHMGEEVWYFFTSRHRRHKNGQRPSRETGDGYWKATGKDKEITVVKDLNTEIIGYKKALVYYRGNTKNGTKTNWIMQEYRHKGPERVRNGPEDMKLDVVLCKIYETAKNDQKGRHVNSSSTKQVNGDSDELAGEVPIPQPDNSHIQTPSVAPPENSHNSTPPFAPPENSHDSTPPIAPPDNSHHPTPPVAQLENSHDSTPPFALPENCHNFTPSDFDNSTHPVDPPENCNNFIPSSDFDCITLMVDLSWIDSLSNRHLDLGISDNNEVALPPAPVTTKWDILCEDYYLRQHFPSHHDMPSSSYDPSEYDSSPCYMQLPFEGPPCYTSFSDDHSYRMPSGEYGSSSQVLPGDVPTVDLTKDDDQKKKKKVDELATKKKME